MRIETTNPSIKLVEALPDGMWAVRWDMKPKYDDSGNPTDVYWYEEEQYAYIPTIEDVQQTITEWFNKQTEGVIQHGFVWNGRKVYLSDENKFNFKAIIDECARVETAIAIWDKENPEFAGLNYTESLGTDDQGNPATIAIPTGRPQTLLPITLKLGVENVPENFYIFDTLPELQDFFNAGVHHLIDAYGLGWTKIATFDYAPYVDALKEL